MQDNCWRPPAGEVALGKWYSDRGSDGKPCRNCPQLMVCFAYAWGYIPTLSQSSLQNRGMNWQWNIVRPLFAPWSSSLTRHVSIRVGCTLPLTYASNIIRTVAGPTTCCIPMKLILWVNGTEEVSVMFGCGDCNHLGGVKRFMFICCGFSSFRLT